MENCGSSTENSVEPAWRAISTQLFYQLNNGAISPGPSSYIFLIYIRNARLVPDLKRTENITAALVNQVADTKTKPSGCFEPNACENIPLLPIPWNWRSRNWYRTQLCKFEQTLFTSDTESVPPCLWMVWLRKPMWIHLLQDKFSNIAVNTNCNGSSVVRDVRILCQHIGKRLIQSIV